MKMSEAENEIWNGDGDEMDFTYPEPNAIPQKLYHVSPTSNRESILANGLVPQLGEDYYDWWSYEGPNGEWDDDEIPELVFLSSSPDMWLDLNGYAGCDLYEIDTNKINKSDISFDPTPCLAEKGSYCYGQTIPPSALRLIKTFGINGEERPTNERKTNKNMKKNIVKLNEDELRSIIKNTICEAMKFTRFTDPNDPKKNVGPKDENINFFVTVGSGTSRKIYGDKGFKSREAAERVVKRLRDQGVDTVKIISKKATNESFNEGLQEGPGYANASNYSDKPDIPVRIEKKVVTNPTGYWVGRPETRYAILKNGFNPKFLNGGWNSNKAGLLGEGFYFSLDPVDPATVKAYGGEILKVYVPGQYIAYHLGKGYRFVVRPEDAGKIQIIDDEDNSSPYGGSGEKWTSTTSVPMTEAQLRNVVAESVSNTYLEAKRIINGKPFNEGAIWGWEKSDAINESKNRTVDLRDPDDYIPFDEYDAFELAYRMRLQAKADELQRYVDDTLGEKSPIAVRYKEPMRLGVVQPHILVNNNGQFYYFTDCDKAENKVKEFVDTEKNKEIVKISESQLRNIVAESIKNVLNNWNN